MKNQIGNLRTIGSFGIRNALFAAATITFATVAAIGSSWSAAEEARSIPPPAVDEAKSSSPTETAIIAGGCFWGMQGVFQHVKGVKNAVSGYAGGNEDSAHYEMVGSGQTGHAEAVQVTFDPSQITYGQILQIYFSVGHDPTQLNRQGPDSGSQYRSAIFPTNTEQVRIAKAYIAQLNAARVYDAAIVTKIESGKAFYAAEDYHQDFLAANPTHTYIVVNDLPKIASLKRLLPEHYKADPTLVASVRSAH